MGEGQQQAPFPGHTPFQDVREAADCHPGMSPQTFAQTPMGRLSGRPQDNLMFQSLKLVRSSIADQKVQPGWLAAPLVPTSPRAQGLTSCPSENAILSSEGNFFSNYQHQKTS